MTFEDLAEEYARFHGVDPAEARARLLDHAASLEEHGPGRIRIRVVAGEFGPAVTSVVLWLRDYDLDIGCIEVKARRADIGHVIINSRQIIPLPEAEDYLVRRRRKEQQEEQVRQETIEYTWEMYEERYPADQVAIARELLSRIERYGADHELPWPWRPALRSYYMGFQRPGDYYVALVGLRSEKPIQFVVKLPDDPAQLSVANPYEELTDSWDAHNRQWCWDVPSLDQVPDVARALDISLSFQPLTGPMPRQDLYDEGGSVAVPASNSSGGEA